MLSHIFPVTHSSSCNSHNSSVSTTVSAFWSCNCALTVNLFELSLSHEAFPFVCLPYYWWGRAFWRGNICILPKAQLCQHLWLCSTTGSSPVFPCQIALGSASRNRLAILSFCLQGKHKNMMSAWNTSEIALTVKKAAVGPMVVQLTFITDVESCVVVGLVGDELDPDGWALADHTLERYRSTAARVE